MPPHAGNEDRIARAELGDLRVLQRFGELRESREIRLREIDQADRLAGRREVEWTDVEVLQLFGREQREAATPRDDAGDVVRQIVMGGDARAIAEPDAHERLAIAECEIVLGAKARQAGVDRRRADIDRRRNLRLALARDFVEHRVEPDAHRLEIEAAEVVAVEEPAADVGRAEHRVDGRVLVEASQIRIGRRGRFAARARDGPARNQAAQDRRLRPRQQFVRQRLRIDSGDLLDCVSDGQHSVGSGARSDRGSETAKRSPCRSPADNLPCAFVRARPRRACQDAPR